MKTILSKIIILGIFFLIQSCHKESKLGITEEKIWKTGWQMIEFSWEEKYELAELHFDSLLSINRPINDRFLIEGLKIKLQLSKEKDVLKILSTQPNQLKNKICGEQFAKDLEPCKYLPQEKVLNKELQLKIIDLYVQDQAIRGNIMEDIISKYKIDTIGIKTEQDWSNPDEVGVDDLVRNQLKEIINKHGFPTRQIIGKDAMKGVFYIIQHSDGDIDWQKSQLLNIESAIKRGDLDSRNYAYLYDRIKVNSGEKQRYGTQIANVNSKKKSIKLKDLEQPERLNEIRREIGLMPIEIYKRFVLENM